jgi:hypothetical protein
MLWMDIILLVDQAGHGEFGNSNQPHAEATKINACYNNQKKY